VVGGARVSGGLSKVVYLIIPKLAGIFYSSGFAENTNTQNEKGICGDGSIRSIAGTVWQDTDIFKFHGSGLELPPSTGYEWLLRFVTTVA
jgi:hypothetical protein